MERDGLPHLFISKLGHDIEEIRLRALNHLTFKLEHGLISHHELALIPDLILHLLKWFEFEPLREEEKVANLLLALLTSNEEAKAYWHYLGVASHIRRVKDRLPTSVKETLEKINDILLDCDNIDTSKHGEVISPTCHSRSVGSEEFPFTAFFEGEGCPEELQQLSYQVDDGKDKMRSRIGSTSKSVEPLLPRQTLSPGDSHVLASVEHSLTSGLEKHMKEVRNGNPKETDETGNDREDTLIRCCQFVHDVILRDFLPEVFLQQPGIINVLLDLLTFLGDELDSKFADGSCDGRTKESLHWVIRCLQRLVTSLHSQLLFYADPSIPNAKDNNITSPIPSTPTPSSCSITREPPHIFAGGQPRHHGGEISPFTGHISPPSEGSPNGSNPDAQVDDDFQFSLPRLCIAILFQTLSLVASHLSGSNSKIFQGLMSLASLTVDLFSSVMDPIMWTSVEPSCAIITGGLSELFRAVGEVLLVYQGALSQRRDNSIPDNLNSQRSANDDLAIGANDGSPDYGSYRLAYLQLLFLTRSLLCLAPKEPSLCRSAMPKELCLALVISIFDPPVQLMCPKLHEDLVKCVDVISPDASKVCKQASLIGESVASGIKLLKGTNRRLDGVNKALLGLPFHLSDDVVQKCWELCTTIDFDEAYSSAVGRTNRPAKHPAFSESMKQTSKSVLGSEFSSCRVNESGQRDGGKSVNTAVSQTKLILSNKGNISAMRSNSSGGHHFSDAKEGMFTGLEERTLTVLKLFAHESLIIRRQIYSCCWNMVRRVLGTGSAKDFPGRSSGSRGELKIKHLSFLWHRSVLTEIIAHGTTSSDDKIASNAKNIILTILKSKTSVAKRVWDEIVQALLPTFSLLHSLADSVTPLGKSITKMLDPDVSASLGVDMFQVLQGNCRLLYNPDGDVRTEAATRLAWIISLENQKDCCSGGERVIPAWKEIKNRLPDADLLASSGPSILSNAFLFKKSDQNMRSHGNISLPQNQSETILQLLSLVGKKSDGNVSLSDARLRRSALNQIALILEHNIHLHTTFLKNDGLNIVLKILQGALVEVDYENYPECAVPAIAILKHIVHWNPNIRKELTGAEVVYHCILRATILFYAEEGFRSDAGHLLCLLLFSNYILILTPSPSTMSPLPSTLMLSARDSVTSLKSISLPLIIVQRMVFPFSSATHWRHSHHTSSSPLSPQLMGEREALIPGECVDWSIIGGKSKPRDSLPWQGLVRLHGSWEWFGSEELVCSGGRKKIGSLVPKDEVDFRLSCAFPPLLKMSSSEVNDLKATDIIGSCRSLLFQIQNATSHASVECSLCMLKGYLSLWNESISQDGALGFKNPETSPLPWSPTLGRFLSRSPASHQDSELLVQICTFLCSAVGGPASGEMFGTENGALQKSSWMESLLQNPATLQPLLCPFNPPPPLFPDAVCSTQAFDGCPSRRAVCREVLSLIRDVAGCTRLSREEHEIGWAHAINFIAQSLQFGDAERFYDLAFLEWALSCLVQLTGTSGWCHGLCKVTETVTKKRSVGQESIWEGLISGLIELLTAFQHGGQSLPMWASEDSKHDFQGQGQGSNCFQDTRMCLSSEMPSEESMPVMGSFMGLSITRSALLCLNHVLSGMQELCKKSTQVNWEMIWSKVLMNAGTSDSRVHLHGRRHGGVQSWLLPLWSSRDPFVRAAALQLASGIVAIPSPAHVNSTTKGSKRNRGGQLPTSEPPLGLRLLEEGLCGFAGGVWGAALSFFLDQCESNLVREHAALLLTNLISASGKIPDEILSTWVKEGVLFQEIGLVASQLFIGCSLLKLVSPSQAVAEEEVSREKKGVSWSTPGLVQAACKLLQNILALRPQVITSAMWEGNGFLFRRLFGCLGTIPTQEGDDHVAIRLYIETLGLYSEILSLLASCLVWDPRLVSLLPQPVPLASVFMLLDSKKYRTEANLVNLRTKVWKKVFGFISSSLGAFTDHQGKSFPADDSVIAPERYYLTFLGAVHYSITGGDPELKSSALCSLNALSAFELQHSMRQADIPNASQHPGSSSPPLSQLFQCPCTEHEMRSESSSQKLLRRSGQQEDLFLRSKFAFDVLHLLIALYDTERSLSAELSVALSSVLALSVPAKQCALASGLVETLVVKCRQLHASILLRETEDSLLTLPKLPKAALVKNQSKQWMKDMKLLFRVLTNFLHSGDFGDKNKDATNQGDANPVKFEAVRIGLPDVLHKLGTFAMLSTVLFSDFLRLLNTLTCNCPSACQSLVYTSRAMSVGPRQNLALSSLLHLLCELAPKETEALLLLQATHQSKKGSNSNSSLAVEVLSLILSILRNTCDVAECRMIMAKGGLLRSLIKLHPCEKRINNHLVNSVEQLWLHFLLYFTMYPEGQLSVPKVPEMFDLLLDLAKRPASKQESFLLVLRNLSFHPQNRARMLASDDFLELLIQILNKQGSSVIQKEIAASAIWALAANNFKGKQILKGAGLDFALMNSLSYYTSADSGKGFLGKEASVSDEVAGLENDMEKLIMVLNCALKVLGCDKEKRYSR
ncbi:rotatin isoform X2 [Ischnura elegans]|uniref:rotatin isoform X2 n=1 Tax=Ischnura elegans TaxID=197161 RepID=UPI001ED88D79|nr:rotatin isoform X2 [Ischnura elegans]